MEHAEAIQIVRVDFIAIRVFVEIRSAHLTPPAAVARQAQLQLPVLLQLSLPLELKQHLVLFRFPEQIGQQFWEQEWELAQL